MKKFIALIVLVVVLAGAWSGAWFYATGVVQQTVADLGTGDGETAPQLRCAELAVTGFPFRFDVSCTGATMVDGDVTVELAGVRGSIMVYNPTHALLSLLSPATVSDAFTGSQSRVDFGSAQASVRLQNDDLMRGLTGEGWRLARASLEAENVRWTDTLAGENLLASSTHVEGHLVDIPEQLDAENGTAALAAFAEMDGLEAPGFQVADGRTTLEAELTGVPADLQALAGPGLLQRWQAAGGELKVVRFKGETPTEFFETSGQVKLDEAARPEGQFQVAHKGVVERTGDMIPPELRPIVLGGQAADGSYSQTLTLRAGIVLSGVVPVGALEPLF
jgi:hypothetical protein